jgi:hypothetical protein
MKILLFRGVRVLLPLFGVLGIASLAGSEAARSAIATAATNDEENAECSIATRSHDEVNEAPARFVGCAGFLE